MKSHSFAPIIPSFLAICGLLASPDAAAQEPDLPYTSPSTGADGPFVVPAYAPDRYENAIAWDIVRQEAVMFGGANANSPALGDTWTWNGTEWTRKTPTASPAARRDHRMAYDPVRNEVVLFGGTSPNNNGYYADTWTWNGTTWTQKNPAASPSARHGHDMVWDAVRQEIVLFGGHTNEGPGINSDETWTWNGTAWTLKSPATKPAALGSHHMAWHQAGQTVVLFGGSIGHPSSGNLWNNSLNDTWIWDGANWTQRTTDSPPPKRARHLMTGDPVRGEIVMFGGEGIDAGSYTAFADTWTWNGTAWTRKSPASALPSRSRAAMTWDPVRQVALINGGAMSGEVSTDETWIWNGTNWTFRAGSQFQVDMSAKPDGIWHFTTINVPAGASVHFRKNAANTPVTWLATGDVTISGTIFVNGQAGKLFAGAVAVSEIVGGGPGGFNGGFGGTGFDVSGSYAGQPGGGPGGGLPGTRLDPNNFNQPESGQHGEFNYGNLYNLPLIGGSGGGGSASWPTSHGTTGGGGGGAILIASSRDIWFGGPGSGINANGGSGYWTGNSFSGSGSGGAIRLVADRVKGSGNLSAIGGNNGRIRIEGFFRPLLNLGQISPAPSASVPLSNSPIINLPALRITGVAGQNVAQPPTGNPAMPDVVFSQSGPITMNVAGTNIPDGTRVKCRVVINGQVISLPAQGDVTMQDNACSFSTTVPGGTGTIQAFTVPMP